MLYLCNNLRRSYVSITNSNPIAPLSVKKKIFFLLINQWSFISLFHYTCSHNLYQFPKADFFYETLPAYVFMNRNPKGKNKLNTSSKGIVFIVLTADVLFLRNDSFFYSNSKRKIELNKLFILHLYDGIEYSVTLTGRRGKHNIRYGYTDCITKQIIINEIDMFID